MLNYYFLTLFNFFIKILLFSKVSLILVLSLILYLFIKYPKPFKCKTLEDLRYILEYYELKTTYDLMFSFFMIFLYFHFFIVGILILRFLRRNNTYNLLEVYNTYAHDVDNYTALQHILICILIFLISRIIFIKIKKFFKVYFVKIHLYFSYNDKYPWWISKVFMFNKEYSYSKWCYALILKYPTFFYKKVFGFKISFHLFIFITRLHMIIAFFVILYDIIYNNWTITLFFNLLPYLFIYFIYIKFSEMGGLYDVRVDLYLYNLMYSSQITYYEKEQIFEHDSLGFTDDFDTVSKYVFVYLANNLNAYLLDKVIPEHLVPHKLPYCYYHEWKREKEQLLRDKAYDEILNSYKK